MNQVFAFFRLIRMGNLLIMLITQLLAYYFLTDHLLAEDMFSWRLVLLTSATFLAAASGYIINDYLDIKIDLKNKPHRVIVGHVISRRQAMFLHLVFNVAAFFAGLLINFSIALAMASCAALLWFYSVVFKKSFLIGNILIALLSAFVILILLLFDRSVSGYLVWSYAWFAFATTLIREVVKDIEDMQGDAKFDSKTIPIVWGVLRTRKLLISFTLIVLASLFIHLFVAHSFIPFAHVYNALMYGFYMLLFVAFPLLIVIYWLYGADTKNDFSRLSALLKIIMITGMLSMILIKL